MKQRILCIKDVPSVGGGNIFTKGRVYKADLELLHMEAISNYNAVYGLGRRNGSMEWFDEHFEEVKELPTMDKIHKLSIENEKSLEQIALKMSEEVGEVSQALLSYLKANGSAYKGLGAEDVIEECVDVMIVAYSLIYKLGGNDQDIKNLMREKVNKWEEKVKG